MSTATTVLVVFDARPPRAQLHLWVEGVAACGTPISEPSVFESSAAAAVDIGCSRCFRSTC